MTVPKYFRNVGERAIASYNYIDIAEGTGMQTFYLSISETSAAEDYHLGSSVIYSSSVSVNGNWDGASSSRKDLDFDTSPFNLPRTIKGTGLINIPYAIEYYNAGAGSATAYITCKVRKWDGSSETEIASATSATITDSNNVKANGQAGLWMVPITIPSTPFKKGDTLRLTIEIFAGATAGGDTWQYVGFDPKGRTTTGNSANYVQFITGQATFHCPFKLDL